MWDEECGKDKFLWFHDHPQDFAICFWQKKPGVSTYWIAYRAFIVLYFFMSILVVIIIRDGEDSPWYKNPIFYYYWVDFTEILTFVLALVISVQRYTQEKKNRKLPVLEKMPYHYQLMWATYSIAATSAGIVTIVFCIFVQDKDEYPYLKYSVVTHIFNTVCFLIDYSVCAVPFRLLHVYLPISFGLIYVLFTVIYQTSGGTGNGKVPIYDVLDWRKPDGALKTCGIHLMCGLLTHTAYWVMHVLKVWVKRRGQV